MPSGLHRDEQASLFDKSLTDRVVVVNHTFVSNFDGLFASHISFQSECDTQCVAGLSLSGGTISAELESLPAAKELQNWWTAAKQREASDAKARRTRPSKRSVEAKPILLSDLMDAKVRLFSACRLR